MKSKEELERLIDMYKYAKIDKYNREMNTLEWIDNNYSDGIIKDVSDVYYIDDVLISNTIFDSVDFSNIKFDKTEFRDVVFINSDLSNKNFDKSLFNRCSFINCKLVGVSFIDASLKYVEMNSCECRYMNLSNATIY